MSTATVTNGRGPRVVPPLPAGSSLMGAMLAVQAEAPELSPNADGQVQSRTYRYVTLGRVTAAVLPLLVQHELTWATFPTSLEGQPALRYRITHVPSGEYQEDVMALMCVSADPQAQGSALTYARRYALVAVLNLTTGEDDDGAAASTNGATSKASSQPTSAPAKPSERPASVDQRKMLRARAGKAGLTPVAFANVVMVAKGEKARDTDDQEAAARWLKREIDRLPARLVDDVIAGIEAS